MAKMKVFFVVKRELAYNDCFFDFSGGERVVHAYRSRKRAEEVARQLSADNPMTIDPSEGTDQDHHVIEAEIEVS